MIFSEGPIRNLVEGSLAGADISQLFGNFCSEARASGLPLLRGQLGMHILHPLVESVDLVWWHEKPNVTNIREHNDSPQEWLESPTYWMLSNNQMELRQKLTAGSPDVSRFPIFEDFLAAGATDYYAQLVAFAEEDAAVASQDGVMVSWLTDDPGGFTEQHIELLRSSQLHLGLVAKLYKRESTAHNIAHAYLGTDAGERVLQGQIRLGEFDRMPTVVWYSDLRRSTAMAEELSPDEFAGVLNSYFECTAGSVLEHKGEVLRFIGDAVLAVFPATDNQTISDAANNAVQAAVMARQKIASVNDSRLSSGLNAIDFGLGLHVGELMYGNIGLPNRLEFSVIGPVANEVSRLESLTKDTGVSLLVSKNFSDIVDISWRDLGMHNAQGVSEGLHVLTLPAGMLPS